MEQEVAFDGMLEIQHCGCLCHHHTWIKGKTQTWLKAENRLGKVKTDTWLKGKSGYRVKSETR